jgi:CDP-diacylglycerol---serine O-phosphatidyltransferase
MLRRHLPNILTLINLSFGVLAILAASAADRTSMSGGNSDISLIYVSCLFVILAALFDRFDGRLARRLGVASELGKQLDSLCDLISFGVAPAVIAWKLSFAFLPILISQLPGYLIALVFPIAGAFRLARFNLQDDCGHFQGIPITLAGFILTLLNLFNAFMFGQGRFNWINILGSMILMVILSVLMISKIRIRKV